MISIRCTRMDCCVVTMARALIVTTEEIDAQPEEAAGADDRTWRGAEGTSRGKIS